MPTETDIFVETIPAPDDSALVAVWREQRDQAAFAEIVRRYREPVFRLALSILGPAFAGEAEEVAQEVFVRVHDGIATFRGDARFSTWIYRIAFNQALNLKERVRYRAPHVSDRALTGAAAAGDAFQSVESADRNRVLLECVEELPEVYQAVLRAYYWLGASISEIATLTGVPENTAKSYLHRSRKLLHAMLEQRGIRNV